MKLFWILVGFVALNVSFTILQISLALSLLLLLPLPSSDIARSVSGEYGLRQLKTNTRVEKHTHKS